MRSRTFLLALVLGPFAGPLLGQVPAEERIPITDPDRLEKMGFKRDARNVYEWSRLDRERGASLGEKAAATPQTWGTELGYSTIHGYDLQERAPDMHLARSLSEDTYCYDDGGVGSPDALASLQLPEGASLGLLRSWAYDDDPDQDLIFRFWETCQAYGYDPPANTLIAENSTLGSIGQLPGAKSLNGLTVNNRECAYSVQVIFAVYPQGCHGGMLRVQKFQVTWNRQVSPAPATATFNDVPTDHPFFQFVEALAKSGITGGCNAAPPLFCPDAPLTRGQMAVFLAKGLGLQWP